MKLIENTLLTSFAYNKKALRKAIKKAMLRIERSFEVFVKTLPLKRKKKYKNFYRNEVTFHFRIPQEKMYDEKLKNVPILSSCSACKKNFVANQQIFGIRKVLQGHDGTTGRINKSICTSDINSFIKLLK